MFIAFVETDTGDKLGFPTRQNTSGWSLLQLSAPLGNYCADNAVESTISWFENLEQWFPNSMCEETESLMGAIYHGDWNYRQDEYEVFAMRNPGFMSREQFQRAIQQVNNKWQDVGSLIDSAQSTIHALGRAEPLEHVEWLDTSALIPDLEGLVSALELAAVRGARKARVHFDRGY